MLEIIGDKFNRSEKHLVQFSKWKKKQVSFNLQ